MTNFAKGMSVVKVLSLMGLETAVVTKVTSVRRGVVQVEDCDKRFDGNGHEIDADGMGRSRLIQLEAEG